MALGTDNFSLDNGCSSRVGAVPPGKPLNVLEAHTAGIRPARPPSDMPEAVAAMLGAKYYTPDITKVNILWKIPLKIHDDF